MNPVEEDVVPTEVEVRKNSDKPASDMDSLILRKNRTKEAKKEQRRYLTRQSIVSSDSMTQDNLCSLNANWMLSIFGGPLGWENDIIF